eukprot:2827319-Lingulodinium_polyedra.AAC.1
MIDPSAVTASIQPASPLAGCHAASGASAAVRLVRWPASAAEASAVRLPRCVPSSVLRALFPRVVPRR